VQTLLKAAPLQKRTPGAPVHLLQKFIQSLFQTPSALIVLSLTLVLTGIAWHFTRQSIENSAQSRFEKSVMKASEEIEGRIQTYVDTLLSVHSLFAINENITRADWQKYFQSLELQNRYPGIHTFAFARYVPGSQRAEFERHVREDRSLDPKGYPDFSIHPEGARPAYYPIEYVEPFSPIPKQFGFDIGSDPIRRHAVEEARDTGRPISTGRIILIAPQEVGFAIGVPVYRSGLPQTSTEERRAALLGFITAAFNMKGLMQGVFGNKVPRNFDFEIFDGGSEKTADPLPLLTKEKLLYDNDGILHANQNDHPRHAQIISLDIAGRMWHIYFSTSHHFTAGKEENLPPLILFSGITISLLLSYVTWSTTKARRRAVDLAQTMTTDLQESEERFRAIFNQAPSGIGVADPHGRFIQVNKGLVEILGYTEEELLGRTFQEITHPDDLEINLVLLNDLIDGKISKYAIQKRYIHKGGGIVWANLTVSPIRDAFGKITHTVAIVEDITDRREADEELRKSEAQLAKAQEIAHLGSWSLDLTNGSISWSDELYQIYGLAPQSVELTYDFIFSYNHPEDRDRISRIVTQATEDLQPFGFDYRIIRPDGSIRTIHAEGEVHPDKTGKAIRMVGTAQDITERKQAEETLRETNHTLQALIEASPLAIITLDSEAKVKTWNPAAEQIFGWSAGEVIGRFNPIIPKEKENEFKKIVESVLEGKVFSNLEVIRQKKDGSKIHMSLSTAPLRDANGHIRGAMGILADMTERLRAEEAVKQSEAYLRAIIDSEPECVKTVAMDGTVLAMNPAGLAMVQAKSEEEVVGKDVFQLVHPEDRPAYRSLHQSVCQGQSRALQFRINGLQGRLRWMESHAVPLRDRQGRILSVLSVTRDITERREAEEALRESQRTLSTLMSNLPGLVYRCRNDRDWTVEFVSEGCLPLTGYAPSDLIENRTISYGTLIHPDDQQSVWNNVQAALQERKPFQLVYRIITASGEEKWVWEQGQGIFSPGGVLLALEGFVTDITERRQAEEELRRSEAQTRALLHAIPDMMFRIHRDGTYLDFKAAKDLKPLFPPEAFLGKKIEEIMPAAIAQQSRYHIDRALASGEMQIFDYALEMDGQMRNYEARIVVSGPEEILAIVRDITERKRVEEALRKSEERFHLATRATSDAVWDWDLVTDALWWNENFQTLFGHTMEDLESGIASWTSHLHPDDRERVLSGVHAMIEGGGQFWSDEYRFQRGDGMYATVLDRGYVVRDSAGKPVRMIGAMMDITERKDAEEALRIKTEQLAAVSDAMTAYLDSKNWYESSARLLRTALHQTESEYGFIGVVVEGPRLRIIAHEGVDWNAVANRSFYQEALQRYREQGYLDFDRLDNLFGEVIRTGKRLVANDVATNPRSGGVPAGHPPLNTFLGVPIIRENQVVGMIGVANRPGGYSGAEQNGIEILCHATGILYDSYRQREREIALENHQRSVEKELRHSQEQLRNLSTHLHSMVEEERTRISREIHDELGQLLTILKMELSWLKKRLPKKEDLLRDRTKSMAKLVDTTIQTLRKISTELRPGVLDDLGLTAAIEWQVQEFQSRTGMRCRFTVRPEEIVLDPDRSTAVFRIFQETLTNIVRHANANEVTILLEKTGDCLILEVKDNGRGITQSQITNSKSLGLLGIRERALLWGGTVQINGTHGKGTTITVQIPLYQATDVGREA
jgi:PAS domain S-box-containing protein